VLDSLAIYSVIVYLKETFAIRVRDDELLPENFASVRAIARLVASKRG
jgi:acyl carrier protein